MRVEDTGRVTFSEDAVREVGPVLADFDGAAHVSDLPDLRARLDDLRSRLRLADPATPAGSA